MRYSVEVRNERGKSAGASTAVVVPLLRLEPVHDFRAVMTATGPVLSWASGNDFHFVIVRSEENGAVQRFENPALTLDAATSRMTFTDPKFEWEKAYRYSVAPIASRAADANAPGFSFEGEDSPIATVITHDVFPPAVPTGLQAVFSDLGIVHGIDLTWNADTEDDLAGYILYRRIQGTTEWKRLNTELVKTPVFRDVTDLAPGSILEYAVSALDVRGNESARSAITTEKVPQ